MSKSRIVGIAVLILVIIAGSLIWFGKSNKASQQSNPVASMKESFVVTGYIGSEKEDFFKDQDVQKLLKDKFNIVVNFQKAGSLEMLKVDNKTSDFLFPGSDSIVAMYKQQHNGGIVKSDIVFTSPIVLNSTDAVTQALIKLNIVQKKGESYFVVDMPKLNKLMEDKKKWSDIGLPQFYGTVSVVSTDPNKSNSGAQFAALLANTLNGDVVDTTTVEKVIPTIKAYYSRLGFMENSTGNLFNSYIRALKNGIGDKPIISAYENLMIEYSKMYPDDWKVTKDKARILYPMPTVWSQHPVIALNDKGTALLDALRDPEIQKIAWQKHGFRSAVSGVANDLHAVDVLGIPQTVDQVVPMPSTEVMDKLLKAIQ